MNKDWEYKSNINMQLSAKYDHEPLLFIKKSSIDNIIHTPRDDQT